ncbi:hypothetical protein LSUE1_G005409 [Lachnellula suecica]|uniref:Heterokaryon incompatibility domain-containing protein n=1 Tax=Lachnellula suecica TaxID=602035 RepID=A0A8T9C482_9HELO|nr:hypothetical protein LSUE1_G005409 [Lachnellula suecica]
MFKPDDCRIRSHTSGILELDFAIDMELFSNLPCGVPHDPKHIDTRDTSRKWVSTCTQSHERCGKKGAKEMPTRVIDVGPGDGSEAPRLAMTDGEYGEYVTLSHRWDSHIKQFGTTRKNIEERLGVIPLELLPHTFRDAIAVTRSLGYRYLWIDSICIIQDDGTDWERECQRMCAVFENTVVTISALRACEGDGGLLNGRDEAQPLIIRLADGVTVGVRPNKHDFIHALNTSEMNTRGWILQEKILSPAILHFGRSQLYWECCSSTASESYPNMLTHSEGKLKYLLVTAQRHALNPEAQDPYLQWYKIMSIFSQLNLTFEFDRLPAIMGLAERFRSIFQSRLLAGLWLEDLHRGLLWMKAGLQGLSRGHFIAIMELGSSKWAYSVRMERWLRQGWKRT